MSVSVASKEQSAEGAPEGASRSLLTRPPLTCLYLYLSVCGRECVLVLAARSSLHNMSMQHEDVSMEAGKGEIEPTIIIDNFVHTEHQKVNIDNFVLTADQELALRLALENPSCKLFDPSTSVGRAHST